MQVEQCPHCGARVMFISNLCPNCSSDRQRPIAEVASERARAEHASRDTAQAAARRRLWPLALILVVAAAALGGVKVWFERPRYPRVVWPPPSPSATLAASAKAGGSIKIGSGGAGSGWGYVYRDAKMEDTRNPLGWGPLAVEGEFDLPYNLFSIERPSPGYVENSFEVIYHDPKQTRVRLSPGQGDKVVMLEKGALDFNLTFACVGSQVRCGGRTYVLRTNGWYLHGRLVHAFAGPR